MFCKKCGREQKAGQKFCPQCGTPYEVNEGRPDNSISSDTSTEQNGSVFISQATEEDKVKTLTSKKAWKYLTLSLIACAVIGVGAFLGWKHIKNIGSDLFTSDKAVQGDIQGIPFKSAENGKWGMLRPDGSILFEEEFKDEPTLARDGRFMVKNGNGLWEIFTVEENPQKVGDEYISIGDFYDGIAPAVKKNGRITLIDKDGNVIVELEKSGNKSITKMENFHYGYALFEAEDAVGILNTRGEILLEARKYCKIFHVAPQRFLALDMKYKEEADHHNYVYHVIDAKGNQINTIRMAKYEDIAVLADGYIGIEQTSDGEKLYGIMNLEGDVIVKPTSKIKGLTALKNDKFIFSNGENLGVRTIKDEVLIRAKYDAIIWATDKLLWVCSVDDDRQKWSLVDLQGSKITSDSYQSVSPFFDDKNAFVQITDKTWGLVNTNGEEVKNVPDIYAISQKTADQVIESDYVDFDAIVSAVNMTPTGFGGWGMNMKPTDLIKVYNEFCKEEDVIKLDPNEVHTDRLSYEKSIIKGIDYKVELYYSGYITERGEGHYDNTVEEWISEPSRWTAEEPQYIKLSVFGDRLVGKTNILYKKLAVKAKTYGKVYRENKNACVVITKNNYGIAVYNSGSEVLGKIMKAESIKNENINSYSGDDRDWDVDNSPVDTVMVVDY